ncbi:MAG: GerAB/ArcD/ProY family transporter [Bacilli bacterium]|nr:GerAB/ArcD/ProY family transporter [Bacilli bacterium]
MKKITSFEYNSLVFFVMRASFIGLTLGNVINITKQDSWFSGVMSLVLGLIPLGIFIYLKKYDKDKTIAELVLYLFKKSGVLINIFLILGAFLFALVSFSDLTSFVHSQFLYNTDYITIGVCFIIAIIYALLKGINAISKTSLFSFFIVLFMIIMLVIGVGSGVDVDRLKPFFQVSTVNVMHASAIIISFNVVPLFLLTIIPTNKVLGFSVKKIVFFYFLSFLSLINAIFLTISVLGIDLSLLYQYPEFNLLKKFEVGNFIDRLSSLLSLEWIVALLIQIIVSLYFVKETTKTTFNFNEKTGNIFIIITCLTLTLLNEKLFLTNASANAFYSGPMVFIMFSYLVLAFIIAVKAYLKE